MITVGEFWEFQYLILGISKQNERMDLNCPFDGIVNDTVLHSLSTSS